MNAAHLTEELRTATARPIPPRFGSGESEGESVRNPRCFALPEIGGSQYEHSPHENFHRRQCRCCPNSDGAIYPSNEFIRFLGALHARLTVRASDVTDYY